MAESEGFTPLLLVSALHRAGLATLTHTPSPMKLTGPDQGNSGC